MRKPAYICGNKDADQLCGNRTADQRLCFCYKDSTIPLLPKYQASNHLLWQYSLFCVGPGRKPRRQVFSRRDSMNLTISSLSSHVSMTTDCASARALSNSSSVFSGANNRASQIVTFCSNRDSPLKMEKKITDNFSKTLSLTGMSLYSKNWYNIQDNNSDLALIIVISP